MAVDSMKEVFILFGALFAFVLSIGIFAERKRAIQGNLMICLLLTIGAYQLISYYLYCHPMSTMLQASHWSYIPEAAGFMLFLFFGPLNYGYCRSVVSVSSPLPERYWLHFVPGILFAAAYFPVAHIKADSGGSGFFFPGHEKVYLASILLTVVSFDSYMLVCLKKVIPLVSEYPKDKAIFKMMAGTYLLSMTAVAFWPIDIIFDLQFTDDIRMLTSIYLITMFAISRRHPERILSQDAEEKHDRYIKTQLQGLDVEAAISRLDSLMRDGKVYKEKITLNELAERLDIRQHQLSELLNSCMKTTFFNYVNDQRVREAVHLLETGPELQIIEISLEVGFSSLSVFYREFKKRIGVSPAEYRRKNPGDNEAAAVPE